MNSPPNVLRSHYDTLGIKPDAKPEDVKRAYRKKASESHPDRHGGDDSKMQMINKARDVLIDPRRRAEYDNTGNPEGETSIEQQAVSTLGEFFAAALSRDVPNLLVAVRQMLKMQADECRRSARVAADKSAKFLARRDRIKVKAGQENIVHGLIDAAVKDLDLLIAKADETLEVNALASKMVDGYESDEAVEILNPAAQHYVLQHGIHAMKEGLQMTQQTYEIIDSVGGKPIKAWTRGVHVEEEAKQQLRNLAGMPFIHQHVAAMPDVHWGMGATVGSVIATKGAIIPAAVGVDIGCGMIAQRTTFTAADLPDNLQALRSAIEAAIPHGRTNNGGPGDRGAWGNLQDGIYGRLRPLKAQLVDIVAKHPKLSRAAERIGHHCGTLGTGNHFVEVCLDEEQRVWVMLHSGSRGIGNAIGSYFIERAKEDMRRWFINLPDRDLAYIPDGSPIFKEYFDAVNWAQNFARLNRDVMMSAALSALRDAVPKPFACDCEAVNCHHNYVAWERHFGDNVLVTRKGAVDAHDGVLGIIPGSMGAKSFIVRGKGNRESFCSCSHGAGRAMSRGEARRRFTLADHAAATEGVECRKDEDVLDETPAAYKEIEKVMAAQVDLVEIVHTLKQVVCVKG